MKGFITAAGYMGFVDSKYILFSSESDYMEYVREMEVQPKWLRKERSLS